MDTNKLVFETKALCKKENEINGQIIKNLSLIYSNKIHLQMGYGSLFAFCTDELKLSPSAAQRKIDAVRLSEAVPNIADSIESGEISLNKISQVSQFIREEKKLAKRSFTNTEIKELVLEVKDQKTDIEVKKLLAEKSNQFLKPILEKARTVAGGRQILEIEVDTEFLELLKEVQEITSHEGFQTKSQLIKKAMKLYLEKRHPKYQSKLIKKSIPRGSDNSRYIPKLIKQKVWEKDRGSCSFTNTITGKRCGSTFRLQLEHIIPVAMGGLAKESNLTLHCQSHNLFNAQKLGLIKFKQEKLNLT